MKRVQYSVHNRFLDTLSRGNRALIEHDLEVFEVERGEILFRPGEEVLNIYFPGEGTVASILLDLQGGMAAEAAMIGAEGAIGGVVSEGNKPAYGRGVVQIGGTVLRLSTKALERAKERSRGLREHFSRYADCLIAQLLQSAACNASHDLEARLARWLLATQDRAGSARLKLTQNFIAEMLGVQRTYVTRVIGALEEAGAIERGRGWIGIVDRRMLEQRACECYQHVRRHYDKLLPGVYPKVKS